MIALEIQTLSDNFVSRWNGSLGAGSVLELDGSWPSIGVLDLITHRLRNTSVLAADTQQLLKECAAYLALLFRAHLSNCCPTDLYCEIGVHGVQITQVSRETAHPQDVFYLEAELQQLFTTPPLRLEQMPLALAQTILEKHSLLPHFALVRAYSLCMSARSPSSQSANTDFLLAFFSAIADSTARWYGRVFPDEPIGRDSTLYYRMFQTPILDLSERTPAIAAVRGCISYLQEWGLSDFEVTTLCKNLSMMPDPLVSVVAIIVLAASSDMVPPATVLAAAQSKGALLSLFRRTMVQTRAVLGFGGDWLLAPTFGSAEIDRLQLESALGFLPWFYFDHARCSQLKTDPALRAILVAISDNDLEHAITLLTLELRARPEDLDLWWQILFLRFTLGEYETVQRFLDDVSIQQPEVLEQFRFYDLQARLSVLRSDYPEAVKHYGKSVRMCKRDSRTRSNLSLSYCRVLVQTGDYCKALWMLNLAQRESPSPVSSLATKAYLYWGLGFDQQKSELDTKLMSLGPLDRTVVAFHWEQQLRA
jgi:hypothetical protein